MINFSNSQNKTIAAGVTSLAIIVVVAFAAAVGWGILKCLGFIEPAIMPVILGLFLSMLFKPYYLWLEKIFRYRALVFLVLFTSILLPVGFFFYFFGSLIFDQVSSLITSIPNVFIRLSAWVNSTFPNAKTQLSMLGVPQEHLLFLTDPTRFLHEIASQLTAQYGTAAIQASISVLKYIVGLGSYLIMLIFFAYFIMRPEVKGEKVVRQLAFLKDETKEFVARQIDSFVTILVGFFRRQVLICLIEGFYYGIGFKLVGLPGGFVLGFLLGVLNLVPLLGTVIVLPFAFLIAYFGDGGGLVVMSTVIGVWAMGQFLDGYLITPKIQGDKTGLGYAGVIFSFFFWGLVFQSLLGLLLAIPLSAFCIVLWNALKERYIRPVL
jgi:predicted PurR-regulated permease PerM